MSEVVDPCSGQDTSPGNPDFVITLVHGTWAPDSEWTKEDSKLRMAIRKKLRGSVQFERFKWSGANAHAARLKWGDALKEKLKKLLKRYPAARHFLVAHSHGGNVCLYALRDLDQSCRAKISGLVCMATPFVICRRRDLRERLKRVRGILHSKGLSFGIAIFGISLAIEHFIRSDLLMLKGIGIGLILVLIVLWFNDYWRDWLHQVIKEQVERLQDRTVMDLRAPSPPNPPILCVNPKGDEARGFLRFVQRIAKIPFSFRKRYDAAWFGVGVGIGLWLTYAQMLEEADWNLSVDSLFDYLFSAILLAGVWGTLFAAGGFVLAELGRWFVPTVLKGRAYAFGKAPSYYNWFAEIVVEASPPDSFKDPRIEDFYVSGRLFGLRHSRIYKSDDALNCLAGWISGKDCRRNDS